jgi:hypothetical protein
MVSGLTHAWTGKPTSALAPGYAVLGSLSAEAATAVAEALTHLGRLDGQIAKAHRNKSLTWDFLTAKPAALTQFTEGVTTEELQRAWTYLDAAAPLLAAITADDIRAELTLGADLARAGLHRAEGKTLSQRERGALTERYQAAWLKRARPGGLDESVGLLFGEPNA